MNPSSTIKRRHGLPKNVPGKATPRAIKSRDILKSAFKQPASGRISKEGTEAYPNRKKVSIGGIFKQPVIKETVSKHSRRHKRAAPEHELFLDYQDTVTDARDATLTSAKTKISEAHTYLLSLLTNVKSQNATFKESLDEDTELIFSSLDDEKVETVTHSKEGKEIRETVEIGKRLAAFKVSLDGQKQELDDCWKEWEAVQKEIAELGNEVLGEDVVGGVLGDGSKGMSGKSEREAMDMQFEGLVGELEEEVGGIEKEFVDKMTASEKEIALRQKNERNKLLAEILAVDD